MSSGTLTIHVGSTNPAKHEAVREAIADYYSGEHEVIALDVPSGVSDQPTSLDETLRGAINRARAAFRGSAFSVGLEDGLISVPYTKSGYMNVCACALFDGRREYLGLSSAFEYPPEVVRLVIEEGLDVTRAFLEAGLSRNPTLGSAEGAIGVLTKGRLTRKAYVKQAVVMALLSFSPRR